jgi:hypothetical protein
MQKKLGRTNIDYLGFGRKMTKNDFFRSKCKSVDNCRNITKYSDSAEYFIPKLKLIMISVNYFFIQINFFTYYIKEL